jgi:hypothetical protein
LVIWLVGRLVGPPLPDFEVENQFIKISCNDFHGNIYLRTHNLSILDSLFFGKGPRSRFYGRTAALRLIVQPCDEDD